MVREVREGELIWERQPFWNKEGMRGDAWMIQKHCEMTLFGRRKRYRPLMKFRGGARTSEVEIQNVETRKQQGAAERQRRREIMMFLVRLGRRPLVEGDGFDDLKQVKALRAAKPSELLRLARVMQIALDETTRSIAKANMRKALKGHGGLLMLKLQVRTPAFLIGGLAHQLRRQLRTWAKTYGRGGIPLCISARFVTSAAPSILSIMDNTEEAARKQPEDLE